jgi:opacity protein-like surface antigen
LLEHPRVLYLWLVRNRLFLISILLYELAGAGWAQTRSDSSYARVNTFAVFGAYSNDSSHILLGDAEQRKLLQFGIAYSRRLLLNRRLNLQYSVEFMPIALESDPLTHFVNTETSPVTGTSSGNLPDPILQCAPFTIEYDTVVNGVTYSGTETYSCAGRRWTIGQALSPLGLQLNVLPRKKLQPFLIAHGGYMYSTRPIPLPGAGSFNFTFDAGIGVELFRSRTRSIRAEYRYHHLSNGDTANTNPGVDNGLLQVTYSFGH